MSVWAIVVAAGSGERYGGPKQLERLGDRRVLDHSIRAAAAACDGVVVVVPPGTDWDLDDVACAVACVDGGATRSASVRRGLSEIPDDAEVIVVHDAARPLADADVFGAVIRAVLAGADGAVPGLPISDTVKRVRGRVVTATVSRDDLMTVQTPQAFRAGVLRAAHAAEPEDTDDAGVVEQAGGTVVVVAGHPDNLKITTPQDLVRAVAVIRRREQGT